MFNWFTAFCESNRERQREEIREELKNWNEEQLEGFLDMILSVIAEKQSRNCLKKELDERYRRQYGVK